MKLQAATFRLKVYKDQLTPATLAANYGKIIAIGDTVTLAVRNDAGPETAQDVVVTDVLDGGRTIQWDGSLVSQTITEDVVRVHQKHEFYCAGPRNFRGSILETTGPMTVTSITLNGAVLPVGIAEGATAAGIDPAFVTALLSKLNSLVGGDGQFTATVTGTAPTQTLTVDLKRSAFFWSAWVGSGGTVTQPAVIP